MKQFTLFWLTGTTEIIKGDDITMAFNNAGYSSGALRALDFYEEGDVKDNYEWDEKIRTWTTKK
jgi:hypothetical protein